MLTIIYGDESNCVYNTNVYFKNTYEPEWFETELAKQIVREVDDSEVLSSECIQSSGSWTDSAGTLVWWCEDTAVNTK